MTIFGTFSGGKTSENRRLGGVLGTEETPPPFLGHFNGGRTHSLGLTLYIFYQFFGMHFMQLQLNDEQLQIISPPPAL